jgi:type IV pilus assembly protein PilP
MEPPMEAERSLVKRPQDAKTPTLEDLSWRPDEQAYTYDPRGRRDPFKSLIEPSKPVLPTGEARLSCPPLQDFELASLKLVAIVWGEMGRKAMFKAPNGRGYAVSEEMLIGRQCSRVRRIDSNAVVVEEVREDAEGKVMKEEVVLRLREREG